MARCGSVGSQIQASEDHFQGSYQEEDHFQGSYQEEDRCLPYHCQPSFGSQEWMWGAHSCRFHTASSDLDAHDDLHGHDDPGDLDQVAEGR